MPQHVDGRARQVRLELVDQALGDGSVKGIVITSGKKDFAGDMATPQLAERTSLPD